MRPWASRKSMKAKIDALLQENAELRQQILDLKNVVEQMDGIGHCVSNYCLGCKFCLFIGHSHQIPTGCMRDKLCRHFESVDTQARNHQRRQCYQQGDEGDPVVQYIA